MSELFIFDLFEVKYNKILTCHFLLFILCINAWIYSDRLSQKKEKEKYIFFI